MVDYVKGEKLFAVVDGPNKGRRVVKTMFVGVHPETGRFVTMSPNGTLYHGFHADRYFKCEADAIESLAKLK